MNTQNVNHAYENLISQLRAIRRQWRWLIFSEGLLKCVGVFTLLMAGVLIILAFSVHALQLPFAHWIRIGVLLLSIGIAVYTTIRTLVLPIRRRLTDAAVAARLESTQTESEFASENRILSAVQLQRTLADNPLGYAPEFIEHLIVQTSRDMEQVQRKQVFQSEFRRIRRNAGIAVAGIGLLLITHFLLPSAFVNFAHSFQALPATLQADGDLEKSIHITEIQPGNIQIERGTDVHIAAKVNGHFGAPIELYYRVGDVDEDASATKWQSFRMQATSTDVENNFTGFTAPSHYRVMRKSESSAPILYLCQRGSIYTVSVDNQR